MTRDSKVLFYLESDTRAMLDAELSSRREAGWSGSLSALIEELVRDRLAEFGWQVVDGVAQQVEGERIDPAALRRMVFLRAVEDALAEYERTER